MGRETVILVWTELKLFIRDPGAAFFTLAFPIILLLVQNVGDDPGPAAELGGLRPIDVETPMLVAMVVALLGLTTLPAFLAHYRERGILRRLSATPISPVRVLVAQLAVHLLIMVIGFAGLLIAGMALFDAAAPQSLVGFAVALLVGALAIFAIGFVLAAFLPTGRSATAVGLSLFFPMIYFSGAMMPTEELAPSMRRIGDWMPLTPVVRTLRETWAGGPLDVVAMLVLGAIVVVGTAVAGRSFKW
jgi:ABC-2 type transport system permease protein